MSAARFLSEQDAAALIGYKPRVFRRAVKGGPIHGVKIAFKTNPAGRHFQYSAADVEKLETRLTNAGAKTKN